MEKYKERLKSLGFKGEIDDSDESRQFYSHDASMFEIRPEVVIYPRDAKDVEVAVEFTRQMQKIQSDTSLTARSAGTDMSGGAINDSVIVDFSKHFTKLEDLSSTAARVQPGLHYRDFEPKTLKLGSLLPSYPASRDLCTLGGMVNNNSGGEKSLQYGKTENYVTELTMVWSDGKRHTVKPLNMKELVAKMAQKNFEGEVYKRIFKLLDDNYNKIKAAKPHVTKNSTGYNLWDVWDKENGVFDLTKLIVGAQGTLGFVTDIKLRLVPNEPESGMLVCFMKSTKNLGEIINVVMEHKPSTFESFDDNTLWLSIKFMPFFVKYIGVIGVIKLMLSLIPDAFMLLKGIPRLILMIEFTGQTREEVVKKVDEMRHRLAGYHMAMESDDSAEKEQKFWIMRRQSFNLLRSKVKDKHTAPFIDDLVVPIEHLPKFLPQMRRIIKKYKLLATIAGHMGDGNFHVIPLMKFEDSVERAKLEPAMREVNDLVLKYGGSLSGEHNDGLIRGPWLEKMYGSYITELFRQTKEIFDPSHIFNPHKKANATWDYSMSHLREHF